MKRRILSIALTIALLTALFAAYTPEAMAAPPNTVFGPFTTGNITWRVESTLFGLINNTLYISRNTPGAIPDYSSGSRPPWYGYSAMVDRIDLDASITSIGNLAFADFSNVGNITIRGNVTRIGNDAFRGCEGLMYFWDNQGRYKSFTGLTTIGSGAFYNCQYLDFLYIQDVTSIGADAFVGCQYLANIDAGTGGRVRMYNGVVVEMNAAGTSPIRVIKAPVGLNGVFAFPQNITTITTIDTEAFAYTALTDVVIPPGVTTIKDRAFAYDPDLTTATFMGDAPTSFGADVFSGADAGFMIWFYPQGLRWTTPRWQGYRSEVLGSRVALDRYVVVLETGATTELHATVYPNTAAQAVNWSEISGGAVATVEGKNGIADNVIGVVTGVAPGTTTIVVETVNGFSLATCYVIVIDKDAAASGVLLSESRITMGVGQTPPTLTAVVYPADAPATDLVWSSSNEKVAYVDPGLPTSFDREIVPVGAGTATITVRTADGRSTASCIVTVTAAPVFVPVTGIAINTASIAMGAAVALTGTVQPSAATNNIITWTVISAPTGTTPNINTPFANGGLLSVPFGQTGTVVVEARVDKGKADIAWGYSDDMAYTQRFTINVVQFLPVTGISGLPTIAYAGVPLYLRGTVNPVGAAYRDIEWKVDSNTAGLLPFDPAAGVLTAQWQGTVHMQAIVRNGILLPDGTPGDFIQPFVIRVDPYIVHQLDLRANPGGRVSGAGAGQYAGGEVVRITATPAQGYVFAGWNSTNGGDFADYNSTTTDFTMPGGDTTVTAYFAYVGLPAGNVWGTGGGVVLPTPVQYFTNGSVYVRNSNVSFGFVAIRDFQLFSYVTLDGRTLMRNSHYTADRASGYTEIILANGYLNALNQGAHTLTVYFNDQVSVTAVFSVLWTSYVSSSYSDVYSSDWYYSGVTYVTERGWMTARGSDPGRFRPSDTVTQGEVIDALYRMAGTPTILNQYNQVLQGRDASLEWVRAYGILPISGVFNLNDAITRQDIALLFGRMVNVLRLQYPIVREAPSFADDWQINSAARSQVNAMYRAGIINGRTASTFVPLGNMTRAEFAVLLQRFADAVGGW